MADEPGLWPSIKRFFGIRIAPSNATPAARNVARTGVALILCGITGLVLVFSYGQPFAWSVAVTAVIVSAAALGTGFLLGFLFGIPRSRQDTSATTASNTAATRTPSTPGMAPDSAESAGQSSQTTRPVTASSPRLTVNANLEEISDWLTKIIVGIGLMELNNIPGNLDRLARYVAAGLVPTPASPPPVTFALAIIVYFSVLGFLSGYLLTRLFLSGAFSVADDALAQLREDLQKKSEEVERQKERVDQVIEGADQSARTKETALAQVVQATDADRRAQGSPRDRLADLEARYKSIRDKQPPGDERTRDMTAVVTEIGSLAPHLTDFDVAAALRSPQRESRLGAYALIFAQPKPDYLEPLVDSLITYSAETRTDYDNRPFGEYWGIQALRKVLATTGAKIDPNVVKKLVAWASRLESGTDRWFEMVRIFKRNKIPAQL
jgi:hypothetical protein